MLQIVRRGMIKYSSYKLDFVANAVLGERKKELGYKLIPKFQLGSSADRARIAQYCLQDAKLPLRLMDKLSTLLENTQMACTVHCTLDAVLTRGQRFKITSLILHTIQNQKIPYSIPDMRGIEGERKYQGAYVLNPVPGAHLKHFIAVVDWKSMYSSNIIAHNLSYDTHVSIDWAKENLLNNEYEIMAGGEAFVTKRSREGILPIVCDLLL